MSLIWLAVCGGVSVARAAPATVEWSATTSIVPQLWAPRAAVDTLTGTWSDGGVFNPRLRFGLSGRLFVPMGSGTDIDGLPMTMFSAGWGFFRDQALCDTCADGAGPGWLGSELLGSTDLTARFTHTEVLPEGSSVRMFADVVLPASRDALRCNPMVAAPGVGAGFAFPLRGSQLGITASGRRPFYTHEAAPVGACSPPLDEVDVLALTGPVTPTPYAGEWFGAANPTFTGALSVDWFEPLRALPGTPQKLRTNLSTGLSLERRDADPEVRVITSSGVVTVEAASRPVRVTVPWNVLVGWSLSPATQVELSAANRVPAVLADPGGTFRALPATTSFSAALRGRL